MMTVVRQRCTLVKESAGGRGRSRWGRRAIGCRQRPRGGVG
jgi:hypothetical protein